MFYNHFYFLPPFKPLKNWISLISVGVDNLNFLFSINKIPFFVTFLLKPLGVFSIAGAFVSGVTLKVAARVLVTLPLPTSNAFPNDNPVPIGLNNPNLLTETINVGALALALVGFKKVIMPKGFIPDGFAILVGAFGNVLKGNFCFGVNFNAYPNLNF